MLMSFVLMVPILMIIKAATGISIWKQVVSFVIVVVVLAAGFAAFQNYET